MYGVASRWSTRTAAGSRPRRSPGGRGHSQLAARKINQGNWLIWIVHGSDRQVSNLEGVGEEVAVLRNDFEILAVGVAEA